MVERNLEKIISNWLFRNKILIIYGARQVGKTTLAKQFLKKHGSLKGYYNCELPSIRSVLESKEPSILSKEFGDQKLIVLDEAQYIPEIGRILKIIADHLEGVQVIATGSSSFDLAQHTSEALTGRALNFTLYPFSYQELGQIFRYSERKALLENFLLFGMYPEIVTAKKEEAKTLLNDLTSRYLYKDIFMFENI